MGYANAKLRAKHLGIPVAQVLAEAIATYPICKKTLEIVSELRSQQTALDRRAAEELDTKIRNAAKGSPALAARVTRSEVLDFILQQGLEHVKGSTNG
jgi:hypothetical protein